MRVIGLTGGIASGKSTAARHLETRGAVMIDADKLGHRAYEPDTEAFRKVVQAFGDDIVGDDGQINRRALGGKVFGNPDELDRLTGIVWPEIRKMALAEIDAARAEGTAKAIVLEAAVLLEAGWQDIVDEVWVIYAEREQAIARAMARDGLDEAAVSARIDAQMTNEQRIEQSDVAFENATTAEALCERLDERWAALTSESVGAA
ncbi:MAG: dephospho-CoA kinase [Gammaproteobacteria bacterium]|nr:dephospho-CoA kinase [Gammaproteobacteria bacterium]MYB37414.1 dephospho-CoA kinase [Gammaproteobacteria bacterium]